MTVIEIKVTGMSCGHCEAALEEALAAVAGVDRVISVDRDAERVVVEGNVETDALVAAIVEEGYQAEPLP